MAKASGEPGVPAGTGARLGIEFYDEPERDAPAGWVAATLVCGPEAAAVEQSLFRNWDGALERPGELTVGPCRIFCERLRRRRPSAIFSSRAGALSARVLRRLAAHASSL